jgi:hypothetical protein
MGCGASDRIFSPFLISSCGWGDNRGRATIF